MAMNNATAPELGRPRGRHADDLETSRGGPISIALPIYDPVIPLASSERARKMPDPL
jgi:hypothetical protein